MTTRRHALIAAGAASVGAACMPLSGFAQPVEPLRVIGYLSPSATPSMRDEIFVAGLRELGWIEGKNIRIESRRSGNDLARLPALAEELVRLNVDLIVATSTPAVKAARDATRGIPVVSISADPVGNGFIASLGRPGGNITGISMMMPSLAGKRLELLREILPKISKVAFLAHGADPSHVAFVREAQDAGRTLGIRVDTQIIHGEGELPLAFAAMKKQGAQALGIQPLFVNTLGLGPRIIELANRQRLPAVGDGDKFTEIGGLLLFGPDPAAIYRRMAYYADRVLRGAKPADLPVEQPKTFVVEVNLKTAKELGIKIPQSILLRATKVIE